MPIKLQCACGRLLRLDDALAGKRIRCPECQDVVHVPQADADEVLVEAEVVPDEDGAHAPVKPRSPSRSSRSAPSRSAPSRSARTRGRAGQTTRPQAVVEDIEDYESYDDYEDFDQPARLPSRRGRRGAPRGRTAKSGRSSSRSRSRSRQAVGGQWWKPVAGTAGAAVALTVLVLFFKLILGGLSSVGGSAWDEPPPLVAAADFPELGPAQPVGSRGVQLHSVTLNGSGPGAAMQMRVYLPPGEHPPQSLPCVLVAPAGSNLISGNRLDASNYHSETLPYAEAGMAVVFYSIDGGLADIETASDRQMVDAYKKFKAAQAGVVNGRNALEFVLAKLPQVNPQRVYCVGHSSAGTLSLLLAQHEPRIAACVAYAPCTDVELRLGEIADDFAVRRAFPGIEQFLEDSSPSNHITALQCPTFVFHARDDDNEPFETTERFVVMLEQAEKRVTFEAVPFGGHYQSMIDRGIPAAIAWLQNQGR